MPNGHPSFCQLCGNMVERMGIKYGCWYCAVIVNRRGGIVFPENDRSLQESPPVRMNVLSVMPYNTFKLFKG